LFAAMRQRERQTAWRISANRSKMTTSNTIAALFGSSG
jgi:hypothetical protein